MLEKTQGIVLGIVPYKDQYQLLHIYTEKFGKLTFLNGISRSRKALAKNTMFSPMSLLELEVDIADNSEIHKIKEAVTLISSYSIGATDPMKYAQCLYVAELIDKCIREVEQNTILWDYIVTSLNIFSLSTSDFSNFHLAFTAGLCNPLGFGIDTEAYESGMYFDMYEGCFTQQVPTHQYYLKPNSAEYMYRILSVKLSDADSINMNNNERNILLEILIAYIKLHIPEIGVIKSVDVIKSLFD